VAIYEVGCFLGSLVPQFFKENIGRKKCIGAGAVVMIAGAILQATAYSRAQMIVARVVSGIGMGGINSTVPVFQAEFSPKATRGLCKSNLSRQIAQKDTVACAFTRHANPSATN
jgi:MFS family permease